MKLYITNDDNGNILLCDEHGEIVENQVSVSLNFDCLSSPKASVTLYPSGFYSQAMKEVQHYIISKPSQ